MNVPKDRMITVTLPESQWDDVQISILNRLCSRAFQAMPERYAALTEAQHAIDAAVIDASGPTP